MDRKTDKTFAQTLNLFSKKQSLPPRSSEDKKKKKTKQITKKLYLRLQMTTFFVFTSNFMFQQQVKIFIADKLDPMNSF